MGEKSQESLKAGASPSSERVFARLRVDFRVKRGRKRLTFSERRLLLGEERPVCLLSRVWIAAGEAEKWDMMFVRAEKPSALGRITATFHFGPPLPLLLYGRTHICALS